MNATATDKPTAELVEVTPPLSEPRSAMQPAEARIAVSEWVSEQFIPSITVRTQQQP
jgi:hypothetical protein